MNAAQAALLIDTLLGMSINTLAAVQRFQVVVANARAEGRDISDGELAALKADSDVLTQQVLSALGGTS